MTDRYHLPSSYAAWNIHNHFFFVILVSVVGQGEEPAVGNGEVSAVGQGAVSAVGQAEVSADDQREESAVGQ